MEQRRMSIPGTRLVLMRRGGETARLMLAAGGGWRKSSSSSSSSSEGSEGKTARRPRWWHTSHTPGSRLHSVKDEADGQMDEGFDGSQHAIVRNGAERDSTGVDEERLEARRWVMGGGWWVVGGGCGGMGDGCVALRARWWEVRGARGERREARRMAEKAKGPHTGPASLGPSVNKAQPADPSSACASPVSPASPASPASSVSSVQCLQCLHCHHQSSGRVARWACARR
ncbi:hypothetical protein K490DRAFT_53192 [Saccharata proteae CBS 121410]|uniref:Uncharacterized protein n=1 Tax=Saccharata proteae CBS 121410 TaxID=1314787 RepID=A0A9P4LYX0_9PEZI|nr:hypothetical protein K490DRAFT_53192 [Saccharata proteae CBS 121410]